uniref:saccharopine dehydrogenase family protein n=1 Tax=Helicobacter bilis TaxID=37372 RepID=UPI0025580B36
MACVLQIGAGGVGGVVAHKMAMNRESFTRIILASRTLSKCQAIADSIRQKGLGEIEIDSVDADSVESVVALIEKYRPKLVVNVALPYQDLSIMEACLRTKTHYLDTANYEHPDSAHFEYKEQWAYDTRYKQAGIFALLGSGFDPGVTNVFCAYAQKHYFDEIHSIDILDCNAGDHGYAFATNFNPEINLREVSSKARYWVKDGHSACTAILAESAKIAQSLTSSKLNRDFLDNPQTSSTILECQDSSNMESQKVDS